MFEFEWLIHYKCNYRCPYCVFEGYWDEVGKRNKYLPNGEWVSAWKRLADKYKDIKIIITGGEPSIYPDFEDLLVRLSGFAHISFDTNLSFGLDTLSRINSSVDKNKLFMGLSFHPLFAKEKEFLEKTKYLRDNGFNIRVHYVTYPEQLGKLKHFQDVFSGIGVNFVALPFRGVYNSKVYPAAFNDTDKAAIKHVADKPGRKDDAGWVDGLMAQVKSKGRKCRAGQLYSRVDCDGTAYACANGAMNGNNNLKLGSIFDANFKLNNEPVTCGSETCPCEFRWLEDK